MGSKYNQISMEERCYISQLRKEGKTIRKIATTLDRSPSSISRELLNNCSPSHSYTPTYANLAAKSKRWKGSKLERNLELQTLVLNKQPNKSAQPIANQMLNLFKKLPASVRQTITFDNGTEFAKHYLLNKIGVHTYFCDTHSPWQKGSVENAIGRMRRVLPRKTDLAILSKNTLQARVMAYNHTPRKCLGYLTPAEVFINQVLHFKCESTFPPSRG